MSSSFPTDCKLLRASIVSGCSPHAAYGGVPRHTARPRTERACRQTQRRAMRSLCPPLATISLLCTLLLVAQGKDLQSQVHQLSGVHLQVGSVSSREGLSNNIVEAVTQDRQGFIWIGTGNGLNRFDGHNFVVYRKTADTTSLSDNSVTSLLVDGGGFLWVGTDRGLNRFDPATGRFARYAHDPANPSSLSNDQIRSMAEDRAGDLWVGTDRGLNRLDRRTGTWTRFSTDCRGSSRPGDNIVNAILEDRQGGLWIGTGNLLTAGGGLKRVDKSSGKVVHCGRSPGVPNEWVTALLEDRSGTLWVGTDAIGVDRFDRATGSFLHTALPDERTSGFGIRAVKAILEDSSGVIWIGTWGAGLFRYDRQAESFSRDAFESSITASLSSPLITTLCLDRTGLLWVGTQLGGVNTVATKPFLHWHTLGGSLKIGSRVDALHEDRQGGLWIASVDGGLQRYDPRTGRASQLRRDVLVNSICEDSSGIIWYSAFTSVMKYDPRKGMQEVVWRVPSREHTSEYIDDIFRDSEGYFWVGTSSSLYRIGRDMREYVCLVHDTSITRDIAGTCGGGERITEDRSGNIWSTGKWGLSRFDRKTQTLRLFAHDDNDSTSLSADFLFALFVDGSGTLWVGALNGLNRLRSTDTTFDRFYPEGVGGNRAIFQILQDERGFLWLTSQQGIYRFDPSTGKFTLFDQADGLGDMREWSTASTRMKSGEFLFGTATGVVGFQPDSVRHSTLVPPVVVTGITKLNRPVALPTLPERVGEIVLEPEENVFSVEFAVLSYDMPEFNHYAYFLEGFDRGWIYCGNKREARYTHLDPGDYTFRVKGASHDGVWNEVGASLHVVVLSPWWKTTWAYGLYLLALVGLAAIVRRSEIGRLRLRHQVRLKQLESDKQKDVEQLKSRFFANISHELRTPLTLILGPVEKLRGEELGESPHRDLGLIQRNARRLLELVNQLLDLSKLEAGSMKLQAAPGNIVGFVKGAAWSFQSSAESKGIALRVEAPQDEVEAYFDSDKMEKILTNLLSNAMKFTPDAGAVNVNVSLEDVSDSAPGDVGWVRIAVADTGIGIREEELAHVFDRFYQVGASTVREQKGTGIGLALTKELVDLHHGTVSVKSEPGKGTEFAVRLRLGRSHLKEDEIFEDLALIGERPFVQPESSEPHEPSTVEVETAESKRAIVLIVEDNADVRAYLREYLVSTYHVLEARDGAEGVETARESIPDLVISDVMMPKMDGYELCRTLKLDERTSHVPVILLTAKAGQENKIEGLETGADDYLTKPFDAKELLVRVRNLIELRWKLRERFSVGQVLKPGEIAVTSIDDTFLRKAMGVVEKGLGDETFSVEDFAREVGMSRSQLHRKLTALTGQSPSDFIRYMRLHRAMELLRKSAGTVSEVAYAVGFSGVSYFTKCFREQFGTLPSRVNQT
jgi:signal transduction histidine kinase/ligand-binding sensor domain-containing protein/AraC-like DNA-binding protein